MDKIFSHHIKSLLMEDNVEIVLPHEVLSHSLWVLDVDLVFQFTAKFVLYRLCFDGVWIELEEDLVSFTSEESELGYVSCQNWGYQLDIGWVDAWIPDSQIE